ncbi:KH domain-containing protein [Phormidesmis priestleyi ULC007]|uniref:KH domain-containing protein n=1 Tax=Phormidesmis priestleyi ULC007 TaxID=1920490 RepID=A0A2T1DLD8_9CYAN|nr:KH domain-containing protein [Phormidesmis priestleyi]PSB21265.1 KH domain-containing protein [Phormidesmis priestleyi ULC007]PZO50636.1 MAG: KH domain-containing protein [Phormidesmis priestleyi]
MPEHTAVPDYASLARFLVQPFLETPDSLKVDCEISSRSRVWVRLAFEGTDKGRVFGRGGRNIQAIRSVLEGVAKAAGHTALLDVYGTPKEGSDHERSDESFSPRRSEASPRPSGAPRVVPKPKPRPTE